MYKTDWYWADVCRKATATIRFPTEFLSKIPTAPRWVADRLDHTLHGEIDRVMQSLGWTATVVITGTIQEHPTTHTMADQFAFGQPMIERLQGATIWERIAEPIHAQMMSDIMRMKDTRIVQSGMRTYDLRPVANLLGAVGLGCVIDGRCEVWLYHGEARYAD